MLLEPFNESFFRQFGFEYVFNPRELEFPAKALMKTSSSNIRVVDGSMLYNAQLRALTFEYFNKRMHLSRHNEYSVPKVFSIRKHVSTNKQRAITTNGDGEPVGTVIFRQEGRTLVIEPILFNSLEALEALSDYLQRFSTQADIVRIPAAVENFPLEHIIKRTEIPGTAITVKQSRPIMGRITDVHRLLNMIKPSDISGRLCVAVKDSMITENSGSYLLSSKGAERTTQSPEISMKQSDLAPLVSGSKSATELFREKRLEVDPQKSTPWTQTAIPSSVKKLDAVFPTISTGWHYL